jgi:S1-C subfamily serine protease
MVAGAIAAFFLLPLVATWAPLGGWRVAASIAAGLLLIGIGFSIGAGIGNLIRKPMHRTPLKVVDRLLGAVVNTVVALAVISLLAFSSSSLGNPALTQTVASSTVLRTLDSLTPSPIASILAQVRSSILNDGLPRILDAVGVPTSSPDIPELALDQTTLATVSESVVRVTGNAPSCGTGRVGTGFVIADEKIMTNAHVLAGVTELVVETPGELPRPGTIVYFDPIDDLAVIDVDGLTADPLQFVGNPEAGSNGAFLGYPFGGPFSAQSAEPLATGPTVMTDIYGTNPAPRQVTALAANVQHGNSGGPLIDANGAVTGVIFAKSEATANIGYALGMDEVLPVAVQAPSLTAPVDSGGCTP